MESQLASDFPTLGKIVSLAASPYEQDFLRAEYGLGLSYYLGRLDTLMFSGEVALDAGCGAGQWTLALAQRFRSVKAIDPKLERLSVLISVAAMMEITNVEARQGVLEDLPYPDETFDAVWCYGVIMFTDLAKALSEFKRVLKPGGRVYLCLNDVGWSYYLINERGANDVQVRQIGIDTLRNTYLCRMVPLIPNFIIAQKGSLPDEFSVGLTITGFITWIIKLLSRPIMRRPRRYLLRAAMRSVRDWRVFENKLTSIFDKDSWNMILDAVWMAMINPNATELRNLNRAYNHSEIEAISKSLGYTDFQWATESGLRASWLSDSPSPKYDGYYKGDCSVWECVMVKPEKALKRLPLDYFATMARRVREMPLYCEDRPNTILSNCSNASYPSTLFRHAQWLAERLGGDAYMQTLAEQITAAADTEDDKVRCVIRFVQRAIFRDPVTQPWIPAGGLPDPLTALLCAAGRCGHAASIVTALCQKLGLEARVTQLARHVIAEVLVEGRWVLADADAFKNGIIPTNQDDMLLTLEELRANPYRIDRFPPTGWMIRPGTRFTEGMFGHQIRGYVDALEPEIRGFPSSYYIPTAQGTPPSIPRIREFKAEEGHWTLSWWPSEVKYGRLLGYRVQIGRQSRGWQYDRPGIGDEILKPPYPDVWTGHTEATLIKGRIPDHHGRLFATITPYTDHIEKEPETYFWPSDEAVCEY